MEVDQFMKKAEAGEDNILLKMLRNYFRYFRFLLSVSSFGM